VKRYEGLFILNTSGKEEGIKDVIDTISSEITAAGGKVETVQKMERKSFTRVADKRHNAGYYVNVIFNAVPASIAPLRAKLGLNSEIFRVMVSHSPEPKPAK
jgi:ribosomal protein S6